MKSFEDYAKDGKINKWALIDLIIKEARDCDDSLSFNKDTRQDLESIVDMKHNINKLFEAYDGEG